MRCRRYAAALAVCVASTPSLGNGQAATAPPVSAGVRSLALGTPIRIASGVARLDGSLARLTVDSLTLSGSDARSHSLILSAVDSLWQRKRAVGAGLRRGALTGGLVGLAVVAGSALLMCSDGGCDAGGVLLISGILTGLGAASGAVVGTAIGGSVQHWTLIHPQR